MRVITDIAMFFAGVALATILGRTPFYQKFLKEIKTFLSQS